MNIAKILGIFSIFLAVYFIYQSTAISTYVDFNGKVVKNIEEPDLQNNYTTNFYAIIDGIGVVEEFKTTLLLQTTPSIFLFILSLILFGGCSLFFHDMFRSLLTTKIEALRIIRSIILIVLLAFVLVVIKNSIIDRYPRYSIAIVLYAFTIVLILILSMCIVNKKMISTLLNIFRLRSNLSYFIIGLLFCFIIINGIEIDIRSYSFSHHYAGTINSDRLGIAIFTNDLTHQWSLAYTIFRLTNIALYFSSSFFLTKIWSKLGFSLK